MSRPKGSKNKPKNIIVEQKVKRPRGRPRKNTVLAIQNETVTDNEIMLNDLEFPEIEDSDVHDFLEIYKPNKRSFDSWNDDWENFSISSDFNY